MPHLRPSAPSTQIARLPGRLTRGMLRRRGPQTLPARRKPLIRGFNHPHASRPCGIKYRSIQRRSSPVVRKFLYFPVNVCCCEIRAIAPCYVLPSGLPSRRHLNTHARSYPNVGTMSGSAIGIQTGLLMSICNAQAAESDRWLRCPVRELAEYCRGNPWKSERP